MKKGKHSFTPYGLNQDVISSGARIGRKAGNEYLDETNTSEKLNYPIILYPRTKQEDLFHYYSAIKAEENSYYARVDSGMTPLNAESHLRKRVRQIKKDFEKLLHRQDLYEFQDLEQTRNFLYKTTFFTPARIEESIEHEEKHAKKLSELGYSVSGFNCWLCVDWEFNPEYALVTSTKQKRMIPKEDYKKITLIDKKGASSIDDLCIM